MGQSLHRFKLEAQKIEHACEHRFVNFVSSFDHWIRISWYMNFANFVVLLMIWLMCFWIDFYWWLQVCKLNFINCCKILTFQSAITLCYGQKTIALHLIMFLNKNLVFYEDVKVLWPIMKKVVFWTKVKDIGSLGPPPPFYLSTWWELHEKLSC